MDLAKRIYNEIFAADTSIFEDYDYEADYETATPLEMLNDILFFFGQGDYDIVTVVHNEYLRKFKNENGAIVVLNAVVVRILAEAVEKYNKGSENKETQESKVQVIFNEARAKFTEEEIELLQPYFTSNNIGDDNFCLQQINVKNINGFISPSDKGYVYIIEDSMSGLIKIGKSMDPNSRVSNIKNASGREGRHFISNEVFCYGNLEKLANKNLEKYRHKGEWFVANFDEAVEFIKSEEKNTPQPSSHALNIFTLIQKYNATCGMACMKALVSS